MDSIQKLIDIFRRFPTVGPRTASRFVYYLLKLPKEKTDDLITAIQELRDRIKLCQLCFNPFEGEQSICPICQNPLRNKGLLCIVEKESDLLSIENTKKYNGLYFILGGTVAMLKKDDLNNLRIAELKKRIKENSFSEIIIALNPTPEGKATADLVIKAIKEKPLKITHLGLGLPIGAELEYADEETLENAFKSRR